MALARAGAGRQGGGMTGQPRVRNRWAMLFASGRANHGVVTLAMALACGIPASTLQDRARREDWMRLYRGVWLLPGAAYDHRARTVGVAAGLGPGCGVSHQSALFLHGLGPAPDRVHVTLPIERRARSFPGVEVHRSRTLAPDDVVVQGHAPVTSAARTLRDVASTLHDRVLYDAIVEAERLRLVDLAALQAQARRQTSGAGGALFRELVQVRIADRTDSALERDTVEFCRDHGYEPHPGPYPLRCHSGRVLHLDVAFVPVRHVLECDGYGFHNDQKAFEVDRLRWSDIFGSRWTMSWVTRRRLRNDPQGIIAEVRRAHERAARRGPR